MMQPQGKLRWAAKFSVPSGKQLRLRSLENVKNWEKTRCHSEWCQGFLGERHSVGQGPKGELKRNLVAGITLDIQADQILVGSEDQSKAGGAFRGLSRALVANMVDGVSKGFQKVLEINGVGYRAEMKGNVLNLALGYSHGIEYPLPEGITAEVEKQTKDYCAWS
jgi:ribosomal protein L6P/L9E